MPLSPDDLATLRGMIREEVRAAVNDWLKRSPDLAAVNRNNSETKRAAPKRQSQGERWAVQIAVFLRQPDTPDGNNYVRGIIQTAALCGFDHELMSTISSQAAESPDNPYRRGLVRINAVRAWLRNRPDIVEFVRREFANRVYQRNPADPP